MAFSTHISGLGFYLPVKTVSNQDLQAFVDTSDEWIRERTGIHRRHVAAPTEMTSDLGHSAAVKALKTAGITAQDLQAIIFATATPDQTLPQTSCILQRKLGATNAFAFDLAAACSGFVYGLSVADSLIRTQGLKHVLIVGAETLSRVVDYTDRETCILFGDGAGAAVMSRIEKTSSLQFASHLASDGNLSDLLTLPDSRPTDPFLNARTQNLAFVGMRGKEVFKNAVRAISDTSKAALAKADLKVTDINWFVPHQANIRIMSSAAELLGVDEKKVISTIADTGNTSSASIPIALAQHFEAGLLKRGDKVLIAAFGAGLTSGAAVFEF